MSKSKKTTKAIPGQDQVDSATAALNERDTKIAGLENTLNQARNTIKLLRQSEYSEGQIREEIYRLARVSPNPPKWLTDLPKGSTFGVPMSLWSDWHAGEVVTPQEVGGTNEFNTAVLNVRVKRLVDQIIDVCFNKMTHTSYPGIVVCLGGDMISGDIHEELAVTNDRYTLQTLHDLLDVLIAAITKLADRFGNVFLPCVPGNHGRSTKKPRAKGRAFCLDKDTPILTRDLRWVPAGSLKVGDKILAFDEEPKKKGKGRRYKNATITHQKIKKAKVIKIVLESGKEFYATPEHKFLAHGKKGNSAAQWISAQEMLEWYEGDRANKGSWKIDRFMDTWETKRSYEAGYLAGAFDSDGSLILNNNDSVRSRLEIGFSQANNATLAKVKECLDILGYGWQESIVLNALNKYQHYLLVTGGTQETLRFLGELQPPRLMAKWAKYNPKARFLQKSFSDPIVHVEDGGEREIAEISSSAKTYISDGYASHNTSYEWHLYCLLERYFQGDKRIRFYIPPETDAHFTVSNHRFLLTHGDALGVKGGDGIIGAIGPIMRGKVKVSNAESHIGRSFDTILMGHWHQYIALMGCIVNGCFTPDTLVQTDKGARQIVDIKKGDIVLSRDGSWQTVTHKFTKQSDQGLVKLKVRGLPELLNVTPNHLVWGVKAESALAAVEPKWRSAKGNADKPQWIPADFISPGDWVHIPRHFGSDKAFSKNLAWVYGLFIAEGHTIVDGGASGAHNRIEFSCHIDELPWLEKVKKILVKEMPELVNNSNVRIWTRPNKTTSHLSVSGRDIAVKFREMFGHTSHNKKIPDSFRNLSPEIAKAVVQGWLDGDGHTAYKADCVVTSATTVSKQLAHDMFALALTSGYNPSLAKLSKGGPRKSDSYTIHFNAGQETRVINDELFYRVHRRFRTDEKVKVYDLEVSGEHTYNAGFVGVHNSLKGYDEYARLFIRAPFQLPIQAMWFVNPQGQVSNNIPLYLEDQLESTDFNDKWVSWNPTDEY